VIKSYKREPVTATRNWREDVCAEGQQPRVHPLARTTCSVPTGELMPAKKDQQPPDLRYFNQPKR